MALLNSVVKLKNFLVGVAVNWDELNRTLTIIGSFTMLYVMFITPEHESDVLYSGIFTLLGYALRGKGGQ